MHAVISDLIESVWIVQCRGLNVMAKSVTAHMQEQYSTHCGWMPFIMHSFMPFIMLSMMPFIMHSFIPIHHVFHYYCSVTHCELFCENYLVPDEAVPKQSKWQIKEPNISWEWTTLAADDTSPTTYADAMKGDRKNWLQKLGKGRRWQQPPSVMITSWPGHVQESPIPWAEMHVRHKVPLCEGKGG